MSLKTKKNRYISPYVEALALQNFKMAFISGPRQVGKTTCAKALAAEYDKETLYRNWDDKNFRRQWTKDPSSVVAADKGNASLIILDEIHKAKLWKRDLKGLYDLYGDSCNIIVTGSARLNIFKKGGDSLLGRYIPFRLHPFSLGELTHLGSQDDSSKILAQIFSGKPTIHNEREVYERLFEFGGFPDPFSRSSTQYLNIWHQERIEKLIREDLRDLSRIPDLSRLEMLASLLPERSGGLLSLESLREDLEVAHNTVKNWLQYLEHLYYVFLIRPYSNGVARSLKKEPKIYLWDWSEVEDLGARFENLVASALLKSCDFWTDIGRGVHQLHYLRDKEKREVDFLLTRKRKPILSIESKLSDQSLSRNFINFCKQLGISHHIQLVHQPGVWYRNEVQGIQVLQASAEYVLPFFA
jgi:predicted AAA+ superfamily ATPase